MVRVVDADVQRGRLEHVNAANLVCSAELADELDREGLLVPERQLRRTPDFAREQLVRAGERAEDPDDARRHVLEVRREEPPQPVQLDPPVDYDDQTWKKERKRRSWNFNDPNIVDYVNF